MFQTGRCSSACVCNCIIVQTSSKACSATTLQSFNFVIIISLERCKRKEEHPYPQLIAIAVKKCDLQCTFIWRKGIWVQICSPQSLPSFHKLVLCFWDHKIHAFADESFFRFCMSAALSLGERTLENRTPVGRSVCCRAEPCHARSLSTILLQSWNPQQFPILETKRPATIYNPPDSPALGRVAGCDCYYTLQSEEHSY